MQKKTPRSCNPKDLGPGKCKKHAKTMQANMQKNMQLALPKNSKQYTIHTQFHFPVFALFLCFFHCVCTFFCFLLFLFLHVCCIFLEFFQFFELVKTGGPPKKANNARFQFVFSFLFAFFLHWYFVVAFFFCIFWSHFFFAFLQVLAFLE